MHRVVRCLGLVLPLGLLAVSGTACKCPSGGTAATQLLRQDRSAFYTYLQDFGVDNDPDRVFELSGGLLRISGQHFGYFATKGEYENYRLVAEFKWGNKTWAPRLDRARDSGVLLHGTGADKVWPTCIETQLIEGGTGDILVVNGAYLTVAGETKGPQTTRFDRPGRNPWEDKLGFRGPNEIEKPHGEWNRLEMVCDGDMVSVTVNGHQTIAGTNAIPHKGKILLQSEGAELCFRRLDLYPLHWHSSTAVLENLEGQGRAMTVSVPIPLSAHSARVTASWIGLSSFHH